MQRIAVTSIFIIFLSFCRYGVAADDRQVLMTKLAKVSSFQADFSQQVTDAQGNTVHQASGQISMSQPNLLRWHTTAPDEILLVADGESVWQVDYFVDQVTVIDQAAATQNNPIMLLTSNDETDWQRFEIKKVGDNYQINSREPGHITALTLTFDADQLIKLISVDAQGQESTLQFSNVVQNTTLDQQKWFSIQVPEGFYIDDQRQPNS